MTTTIETISAPASGLHRRSTGHSTLPPDYGATEGYELAQLSPASSSAESLPRYTTTYENGGSSSSARHPSGFHPSKLLQIEAPGFALIAFPLPPRPDPIYVFGVNPTGELEQAEYVSIRPARNSGSCFLARPDDPAQTPICTTTYRFGPGKPPKIRLLGGAGEDDHDEEFELSCKGCLTRSVVMRTHLGTFEWRYSSRAERRAAQSSVGEEVDCLLVLDRVTNVALEGGKQEERRMRVAQFVRSAGLRTPGTRRSTAGNGGRLILDLREWADRKGEAEQMELLAVASCVSMMKKEVDRRRMHQTMVIMGGASGGP